MGAWQRIASWMRRPSNAESFEASVEAATAYCVAHLDEGRTHDGEWRLIRHLQHHYGFSEEWCTEVIQAATDHRDIAALGGRDDTAAHRSLACAKGHTISDTPTVGSHTVEWECTRDGCTATIIVRRGSGRFVHATVDHVHPYLLVDEEEESQSPA